MAISKIKATFNSSLEKTWSVVTSLTDYSWRSDLSRIEVISDTQFVEYSTAGYKTTFTTTVSEHCKRWEFDMENENIKGHWVGIFKEDAGKTEIDFTEDVTVKRFIMKPFVKGYLRKQQLKYVSDLKKALS